jgi:XRE family aerobic/anaerobic benzoate catabolism transcriptional regulator
MDPKLLSTLLTTCFVVWLHAQPEEYMRRLIALGDVRPMEHQADAMADLRRILAERNESYSQAHASLDTNDKSVGECVTELMRIVPRGMQNTMNEVLES